MIHNIINNRVLTYFSQLYARNMFFNNIYINDEVFIKLCASGQYQAVKLLLPHSNPQYKHSRSLQVAVDNNHIDIV